MTRAKTSKLTYLNKSGFTLFAYAVKSLASQQNHDRYTLENRVTVSERAAKRIAKILSGETIGSMLRVSVEGGGCSGLQYKYDVVSAQEEDDFVIVSPGATVLIDSISLQYMSGSEIDFVDDIIGQSFQINNPNAVAGCGCGTSFTI